MHKVEQQGLHEDSGGGWGLLPHLGYRLQPALQALGREDTGDLAALVGAKYLITSYVTLINLSSAFTVPSSRVDASGGMAPRVVSVPGQCSLRLEREHPPLQQE